MNGDDRVSFEYNADGIRTEKTLRGEYTEKYLLDGDKVVEIVRQGFEVDDRCVITYDESGNPFSFEYYSSATDTTPDKYYYVFNLQGDVIQLRTADGTIVANYVYDAWGKPVSITGDTVIANRNPLRYRGYFYDTETGLYYCNSRYYDPEVKRFVNADGYITTGQGFVSYNMYSYCLNNPVMYTDFEGTAAGHLRNWMYVDAGGMRFKDDGAPYQIEEKSTVVSDKNFGDSMKTEDGTYALYDNDRFYDQNAYHEQVISFSFPSEQLRVTDNTATVFGIEANLYTGGWEYENLDLSLLDFGHAEAQLELGPNGFGASALASGWSPSVSFSIKNIHIECGIEVASVGGKFLLGIKKFSFGAAFFGGFDITVHWD